MRLVVRDRQHRDGVVSRFLGLPLGQAGAAAVQARELDDAGTQHAWVGLVPSGEDLRQRAPLQIGGGAHRRPLPPAGEPVRHYDAVAGGVHVGEAGAEAFVHKDGALVQFNPAGGQKRRVGADARRQHDQFRRKRAAAGLHRRHPAVAQQLFRPDAGHDADALLLQMPPDVVRHLRIQYVWQKLRGKVEYGHLRALRAQVVRRLQTDEAAADDDGLLHLLGFDVGSDADGVFGRPHFEHALQFHPLDRGDDGRRADGEYKTVVGVGLRLAGQQIFGLHRLRGAVQLDGFPSRMYGDAGERGVFFGRVDDQRVAAFNQPADVVRQAAARIGDVPVFGEQDHIQRSVLPLELGCGFGARRHAADDQYFHCVSTPFPVFSVFWQTGPPSVCPRVPRQAAGQAGLYVVSSGKVYRNSVNLSTL